MQILTSVPVIFTHGDLHSENILVCDDRTVVIDFEHCCRMHAFYDLVYNPFDGFIAGYDTTLFDELCSGTFDREYRGIFLTFMSAGSIHFPDVIFAFIICRAESGSLYPVDKLQYITALAVSGKKLPVL